MSASGLPASPKPMSRPEDETSCSFADCEETATVALRFGNGTTRIGDRQTSVAYCPLHLELVRRLFFTCDERPVRSQ